jgi:hypothetical protein
MGGVAAEPGVPARRGGAYACRRGQHRGVQCGQHPGPVADGLAIAAGYGYAAPSWIALVLVIGSILLGVAGWWKDSHP